MLKYIADYWDGVESDSKEAELFGETKQKTQSKSLMMKSFVKDEKKPEWIMLTYTWYEK